MDPYPYRKSLLILLFVYLIIILRLVLFKDLDGIIAYTNNLVSYENAFSAAFERSNFIPFKTFYYYFSLQEKWQTGFENIGGNIIIFIPLGIILTIIFNKKSKSLFAIFFISAFLETVQLLITYGNFDIDDIILNMIGGWIGFIVVNKLK
jgi:glycopeptide antibiotics resistance protein